TRRNMDDCRSGCCGLDVGHMVLAPRTGYTGAWSGQLSFGASDVFVLAVSNGREEIAWSKWVWSHRSSIVAAGQAHRVRRGPAPMGAVQRKLSAHSSARFGISGTAISLQGLGWTLA